MQIGVFRGQKTLLNGVKDTKNFLFLVFEMPRNYVRKAKPVYSKEDLLKGVSLVKEDGYRVVDVAKHLGIPKQTLYDHLKSKTEKQSRRLAMNETAERSVAKLFLKVCEIEVVPTWKSAREKLLYLASLIQGKEKLQKNWREKGEVTKDWLAGFRKRNKIFSLPPKINWLPEKIIVLVGSCYCAKTPLDVDFLLCGNCSIWTCEICFGKDSVCAQCSVKLSAC